MDTPTARSVTITVRPEDLEDQSKPDENHYVWAYHIRIQNQGQQIVQFLTRYWQNVDCTGRTQEVRGPGGLGAQTVLRPGERCTSRSSTPLSIPSGCMLDRSQITTNPRYRVHGGPQTVS